MSTGFWYMSSCPRVAWRIIYSGVSSYTLLLVTILNFEIGREAFYNPHSHQLYFVTEALFTVESGGSYFQPLSWSVRMEVAIGAARGLAFLHNAETQVIYRDFKTSNILLDSVFTSCSLFWLSVVWSNLMSFKFHANLLVIPLASYLKSTELQCKTFWFWVGQGWANWR